MFTITSKLSQPVILGPAGDGQPMALEPGDTVEVSERQAVHALDRPDLDVSLPDGYAEQLQALAGGGAPKPAKKATRKRSAKA